MEALLRAIADAGLSPKDIDGVIPYATGSAVAEDFITNFGIADLRISAMTPLGGASCLAAVQLAVGAIVAGIANHRSEEHTSELQSLMRHSYAVFCLNKNKHSTINLC